MGFEPFIPPKRTPPTPDKVPSDAPREERVLALARMLHQRGITSSMTDAKRLAEGMVDVEKKVVKQQKAEQPQLKAEVPGAEATVLPKPSFGLRLPEEFTQFVARAAALSHDSPQAAVLPAPVEKPVVYGREEQHVIAAVPHFHASNQRMFDDAPDVTKLRGFSKDSKPGTPVRDIEFQSQREKALPSDTVVRMESSEDAVKIVRSETAPGLEIVEEQAIYAEPDAVAIPPVESAEEARPAAPTTAELLAEDLKDAPEETVELPKSERKQFTDPAKEHGVDLFSMFKKK